MVFKNDAQLKAFILPKIASAVAKVEEQVHKTIDNCLKQYYGEFSPNEYIRTSQLLHSLVKSGVKASGNGFEAEVYFDEGALSYQTGVVPTQHGTGFATWGAEEVLDTAMHGSHGGYEPGTAIWDMSNTILGDIYKLLKQELIAQGIPIK